MAEVVKASELHDKRIQEDNIVIFISLEILQFSISSFKRTNMFFGYILILFNLVYDLYCVRTIS